MFLKTGLQIFWLHLPPHVDIWSEHIGAKLNIKKMPDVPQSGATNILVAFTPARRYLVGTYRSEANIE